MKRIFRRGLAGVAVVAMCLMTGLGVARPAFAECVQTEGGWVTSREGYECDANGNEVEAGEGTNNNGNNSANGNGSGSGSGNGASGGSTGTSGKKCVSTSILGGGEYCDDGSGKGIVYILGIAVDILTFGIGVAATIGLVVSGIQYLTAGDNVGQIQKARMRIFQIVIGLAIYAVFWGILQFLLPGGLFGGS